MLAGLMTNLSVDNPRVAQKGMTPVTINSTDNKYTPNHQFGKDEFGYDDKGRPMLKTDDYRFVFVKNGDKIDALVYTRNGEQKETIRDIEKKGLR
jgi:hypothetical protein